jgi:glycosyltransferase involved in cell wall biosynthesis
MRLLYVSADPGIPVLGHKGASVHVRELVTALTAEGASVALASPRIAPEGDRLDAPAELIELEPVVAEEHPSAASLRAAMDRQAGRLMRLAEQLGVDAIYERYSLHSRAAAHVAEALHLPYVLEVNAPLRDEARRFRSLVYPEVAAEIEARVYVTADRIFAVSMPLAQLLARTGVDRAKVEVMRNAVTPEKFPAHRHRGQGFTVGFAGSLKPWHGVEVLADAFASVARKVFDLRLEVVGDGPLAGVLDRINLPPKRLRRYGARPHDETLRILASWDIGVAPYIAAAPTFYFSPLKVAEYMAAGACPVASDLGDIRYLLGDGERGVLVPPGDASALASALIELARDRARVASVGALARRHAHTSLSWRGNARRVLDCLQSDPARGLVHGHP